MNPRELRSTISTLDASAPITTTFERALRRRRTWGTNRLWYQTQKEHWLGWLMGYSGPGYYGRKDWNRDAEFVYNHIVCPPMVLWLGEASGLPSRLVCKAMKAALAAPANLSAQASAIRRVIPWPVIEDRLTAPDGHRPKVSDAIKATSFYEYSVYTIVDRKKLNQGINQHKEGRLWTTAANLLAEATQKKSGMPVLFGNADDCSRLSHWGLLTDIEVNNGTTVYTVDKVRRLGRRHTPQELVLRSTGKRIAPNFIRPYAICKTPAFLIKMSVRQGSCR